MNPASAYAKATAGGVLAGIASLGVALSDGHVTTGEWLIVLGAVITGALGVGATKNTTVVRTGPGDGPVIVGEVLSSTGAKVGEVVVDTGTATGGVVAGTTGIVGQVLDATLGKVLPGTGRHTS